MNYTLESFDDGDAVTYVGPDGTKSECAWVTGFNVKANLVAICLDGDDFSFEVSPNEIELPG